MTQWKSIGAHMKAVGLLCFVTMPFMVPFLVSPDTLRLLAKWVGYAAAVLWIGLLYAAFLTLTEPPERNE